ncbi:MAG: aminomethyl-transferring glycine dehydrogenase subunit GcvPA [Planctomycetales bacterium]|nr:aminomethyl-transferring glycine dehydrogenase subunit GcvPA [Planctomycetales bacterium]MCA9177182.1 aminomethyl-transferring glycine dehydrogenase subunit GcvPA [Planctomycetales bacterium]
MAYLFNTVEDVREMLAAIGAASVDSLFDCIPREYRYSGALEIPPAMSEIELTRHMEQLASRNQGVSRNVCFLGGGAYDHFIPAVVDHLAGRGEFYTSYTPYQPEVSQGNLQVMFEYETLICELTGMDVSNASLYDGASATIEAVLLAMASKPKCTKVLVPDNLHPEYRQVLATYLQWTAYELVVVSCPDGAIPLDNWIQQIDESVGCVVLSQPNFFGIVEDLAPVAAVAKDAGAVVVAVCDMISLGILASPASWHADIVVGEGQVLGNPLQYGGPYLGIMACRESFVRRMPGRIAGQTEDKHGHRCWVLTLQTREQHIRRDKATSNICTNQGLFALRAAIYLALQGPVGLRETAEHCAWKIQYLQQQIVQNERFELRFAGSNWREFVVRDLDNDVSTLLKYCRERQILAGLALETWYPDMRDCILIAATEKRTRAELDQLVELLNAAPRQKEVSHA